MRNLTENEKVDVKQLLKHNGFKILEWLLEDFQKDIMTKYLIWNLDLEDKEILQAFTADKAYMNWAKAFVEKIKISTKSVWVKKEIVDIKH